MDGVAPFDISYTTTKMDSVIETQRALHEEIERYEQALADVLMQQPSAQRNITRRDRKAAEIMTKIGELRQNLVLMYEDAPGYVYACSS